MDAKEISLKEREVKPVVDHYLIRAKSWLYTAQHP